MNYNINYEISALVFLIIVIGYFYLKRKYINLQGKIYSFYVLFIFFNIVTNIISVGLINSADQVPLPVNYIVNEIYMCCQLIIPAILLLYILSLTNLLKKNIVLAFSLPILFGVIMVFLNPFTEYYFYFNEQLQYMHGIGHHYLYMNAIVYVSISLIVIIRYRKRLGAPLFFTFLAIILIMVSGMIIQAKFPNVLITGTGAVLSQLMLYLAMENPDNYSDSLTSVLNEDALKSKVSGLYEQGKKAHLVIVSLSDFKMINEVFSRSFGDVALKQVADYLRMEANTQTVFRVNGDVFIILTDNEEKGLLLKRKIMNRLKEEWHINHNSVRLSAKLGSMHTSDYKNSEELFVMLEHALSEMKEKESKKVYIVDEEEKEKLKRKSTIKRAIADIISKEHIEMAYQPIFYADGKLRAIESLARMNLVKYGYISPDEFIKMAEMNGAIIPLGNVIIKEVLNFIEENKEEFDKGLLVGINLSVIQLMKPSFSKEVLALLKQRNINSKCIVFEITESEAIYSDPTVIENIRLLKEAGSRLAMDDYGTGYANLNNMADIPFSTIKIDKQVIWNSLLNQKAKIILVNTVKMLQELNYDIVAEGIETQEHVDAMKHLNINMLQGYFYTKPVSKFDIWNELAKIKQRTQIELNSI